MIQFASFSDAFTSPPKKIEIQFSSTLPALCSFGVGHASRHHIYEKYFTSAKRYNSFMQTIRSSQKLNIFYSKLFIYLFGSYMQPAWWHLKDGSNLIRFRLDIP